MTKIHVCLTAEYEIVERAKKKGFNLSQEFESSIRGLLDMEEIEKKIERYSSKMKEVLGLLSESEIKKASQCIKRDPGNARGWKRRIERTTGVKIDEKELLDLFGD